MKIPLSPPPTPRVNAVSVRLNSAGQIQALLGEASTLSPTDKRVRDLAERLISWAQSANDAETLCQSALLLSEHYLALYDYSAVKTLIEPLLGGALGGAERAQILLPLISAHHNLEELEDVLRYATEALKLSKLYGDRALQARLHNYLGDAYARVNAPHESLEHHLRELELLKTQGAALTEPYMGIGWIHCQLGNYAQALDYLQQGLASAQEAGDTIAIGRCLGNLANVYDSLERREQAINYHQQATDLFEKRGDFRRAMVGYGNLGQTFFKMGDSARAVHYYQQALEQLRLTPNEAHRCWILIHLGQAIMCEDAQQSEQYLLEGLRAARAAKLPVEMELAHSTLSQLYEQRGDAAQALEHYKHYAELQVRQLKDISAKRTRALSIQFEVEQLQQAQEIYRLKNVELARAVEQLEELSSRDSLTGLHNRRYLDSYLHQAFLEAEVSRQPLSVLISDIDNFKQINDLFSHGTGDDVLRVVAELFSDSTWGSDAVARYGGEEFVVVFKDTGSEQALRLAEQLRRRVEAYSWHELHPRLAVTLSIGVCADTGLGSHERMLSLADDNLYRAKRSGKNQVV